MNVCVCVWVNEKWRLWSLWKVSDKWLGIVILINSLQCKHPHVNVIMMCLWSCVLSIMCDTNVCVLCDYILDFHSSFTTTHPPRTQSILQTKRRKFSLLFCRHKFVCVFVDEINNTLRLCVCLWAEWFGSFTHTTSHWSHMQRRNVCEWVKP
jgi:hypothetical protein